MRTLIVSDLHLGSRRRNDLARRAELRAPLVRAATEADRLVLLGDTLELRHGPAREALRAAGPLLAELGAAVGEVVLVAGNHDFSLVAPWLRERAMAQPAPGPLNVSESIVAHRAGPLATRMADLLAPAEVTVAHPGVWVRDDVYAYHGHYADRHLTVPTFERMAAGVMALVVGRVPEPHATPDDYDAGLAPSYAWMSTVAQAAAPVPAPGTPPRAGSTERSQSASARVWGALAGPDGRRPTWRRRALGLAVPAIVAGLNLAGLGPLKPEISGSELRRACLRATEEALRRLGVHPAHAIFGHTHRAGPFDGDDLAEWRTASGTALHNTGSWVYQGHFLTQRPQESPYWPGTAVVVEDSGPPRLERLLGYRGHGDLACRPAATPPRG